MSTIEADALPQPADAAPFHPWRRWLARMVDTTLFGTFGIFVVGTLCDMAAPAWYARFAGSILSHGPLAGIYFGMVSFVAAIPIIACLLSLSGTPGKWLCGIKVVRVADGERPTMRESIIREVMRWPARRCRGRWTGCAAFRDPALRVPIPGPDPMPRPPAAPDRWVPRCSTSPCSPLRLPDTGGDARRPTVYMA